MRNWLLVVGFLIGASIIAFHQQLIDFLKSREDHRAILAQISKSEGTVEIRDENQKTMTLQVGSPIRDQDTVLVGGGHHANIKFNDGLEVELNPGSIAFFENSDRAIFVTLRSGGFKGIARGNQKEKVLFVKDGAVLDPLGRNIMQPPLKFEEEKSEPAPEPTVASDTLTDAQITRTMAHLRSPLLKCYAATLKNNAESKGEIYLSFTIEPNGDVSLVKILQETFKDERLIKCVSEVIQRTRFDSFKGDPIVVNYPIYFE